MPSLGLPSVLEGKVQGKASIYKDSCPPYPFPSHRKIKETGRILPHQLYPKCFNFLFYFERNLDTEEYNLYTLEQKYHPHIKSAIFLKPISQLNKVVPRTPMHYINVPEFQNLQLASRTGYNIIFWYNKVILMKNASI